MADWSDPAHDVMADLRRAYEQWYDPPKPVRGCHPQAVWVDEAPSEPAWVAEMTRAGVDTLYIGGRGFGKHQRVAEFLRKVDRLPASLVDLCSRHPMIAGHGDLARRR